MWATKAAALKGSMIKMSIDRIKQTRYIAPAVILGLGLTGCADTNNEARQYDELPDVAGLMICNGAKIRDEPHTTNNYSNNIMDIVDYGQAPEATCIEVPLEKVFISKEGPNGNWYGTYEDMLASELKGTRLNQSNESNVVWINSSKATPSGGKTPLKVAESSTIPSEPKDN